MNPISPIQIRKLLADIASTDRRDGYVAPTNERAEQLGDLIASEIGAQRSRLAQEARAGEVNQLGPHKIPARPDDFANHAWLLIERWLPEMRTWNSKRVEVAIHNTICNNDNSWGDHCILVIRSCPKVGAADAKETKAKTPQNCG